MPVKYLLQVIYNDGYIESFTHSEIGEALQRIADTQVKADSETLQLFQILILQGQ